MGRDYSNVEVFTTGQIAEICKVSHRTVCRWIDSGRLKGYRIPGSKFRRVPRENLIQLLEQHEMPTHRIVQPETEGGAN